MVRIGTESCALRGQEQERASERCARHIRRRRGFATLSRVRAFL